MGAAPPEAHRQDGESAPTAAGVAAPRQSQPREAYGARAASNTGKTVGGRARAGRRAAAFPGGGASRRRGACRGAGYLPLHHQDGRLPGQVLRGAPLGALLRGPFSLADYFFNNFLRFHRLLFFVFKEKCNLKDSIDNMKYIFSHFVMRFILSSLKS